MQTPNVDIVINMVGMQYPTMLKTYDKLVED